MSLLQWSDDLSVGVTQMDAQHKQLVDMVNSLHEAMKAGKSKEHMTPLVSNLKGYVQNHFTEEERYMAQIQYPGLGTHALEHSRFIEKVLDFETALSDGKQVASVSVMTFLRDWLVDHIQGSDKKYGPNAS